MRACRELGIKTVGVFSDPDYNLLHLKFVDQKVALGGSLPQDTYLNEEKIIRACELTEVDAIHPGYGFLSENGAFARKLEEKGITFIGPDADLLERIKDKLQAKRILEEAGIPVVPGSREPLKDENEARKIAEEIGYPLFLKASRGGGGRGIRVVSCLLYTSSFWGAIDTTRVLPRGTKKEVKEEVRKRIDDLGPEGYILTSVHDIQPDVPPENVITMFEEARNYGVFLSH